MKRSGRWQLSQMSLKGPKGYGAVPLAPKITINPKMPHILFIQALLSPFIKKGASRRNFPSFPPDAPFKT